MNSTAGAVRRAVAMLYAPEASLGIGTLRSLVSLALMIVEGGAALGIMGCTALSNIVLPPS